MVDLEVILKNGTDIQCTALNSGTISSRRHLNILEGQAVALANIDPVIELIKSSANAQVAKERLIATSWAPGSVTDMLERAGTGGIRPDDLPDGFGLVDGQYHLSPQQAQAILDLRLHRLTGLEMFIFILNPTI